MNKHLYRIIFNRALGVLQAVAEIARRPGGQGPKAAANQSVEATVPVMRFALWVALGWVTTIPAFAQVVADPTAPGNQRPTVLTAPNGVPVVNIQTPSAAGVSRNTYQQFDVNTQGAILNNSRTNVQTQLGGWVQGNPWLATGTARVILNEVNSSDPSLLNGYIEVGGDRAQVVIANPVGISCSGCGFINANRVTLTTGTPILNGGALDGYRVSGGTLSVLGAGLDATGTDYTDLIARSLQVNAGVWAQQLQIITGTNTVSADHARVAATAATSTTPTFALDVGALGGMYAGKISLLGTEHGVGVRNAGTIGAQAGDLVVTVDGRLINTGSMQGKTNTALNVSGGLANGGVVSAGQQLRLDIPADLDNSSGTLNARRIEVNAQSLQNRGGSIEQTGLQALQLNSGALSNQDGGRIGLAVPDGGDPGAGTPTIPSDPGDPTTPADPGDTPTPPTTPTMQLAEGALNITGLLNNDAGQIIAGGGVGLSTTTGVNNDGGQMGLSSLTLTSGDLHNAGGTLNIIGAAQIQAGTINNDAGHLAMGDALNLNVQQFSNRAGELLHSGTTDSNWRVAGTLDNTDGRLATNADQFTLNTGVLVNERGQIEHAGTGGMTANTGAFYGAGGKLITASALGLSAGMVDHQGATLSAASFNISADSFDTRGGRVQSAGAGTFTVRNTLNNSGGSIATQDRLSIAATTFGNAAGTVQDAGTGGISINAATLNGAGGILASNGALSIVGETTDLSGGTTYAQQVTINTGTLTTAAGTLQSATTLALTARNALDNAAGTISANGDMIVRTATLSNQDGTLSHAGTGTLQLSAATLNGTGGIIASNGLLNIVGETTDLRGGTTSADQIAISTGTLTTAGGMMQAADMLTIAARTAVDNATGTISANALSLQTPVLGNQGGTISQAGTGVMNLNAATLNGQSGTIATNGALSLNGETTDLRGGTTYAHQIDIQTGTLTTAGGTLQAGDALSVAARQALDNAAGTIIANGDVNVQTALLGNQGGTLSHAGTGVMNLNATTLNGAGGTIASNGALSVIGDTTDLRGGTTYAGQIVIHTGNLTTAAGTLQATDTLLLSVRDALDNAAGRIAGSGDMSLQAATLGNQAGAIEHAGTGALTLDVTTLDGAAGTIASNGALSVTGETTDLRGGTTYANQIVIDTGELTTADGTLQAADTVTLDVRDMLDNADGRITGNGDMSLQATTLGNQGGRIEHGGTGALNINFFALNGEGGTIAGNGALSLNGETTDLRGGTTFANQIAIDTGNLTTAGGTLQAITSMELSVRSTLDNTASQVASNGTMNVQAATVGNQNGLISSGTSLALNATELLNTAGQIQSGANATLQIVNAIDNAVGSIAANNTLNVTATSLNNDQGVLGSISGDASVTTSSTIRNAGGQIQSASTTTLTSTGLDNTAGSIAGTAIVVNAGAGTLVNNQGQIAGAMVNIDSGALSNDAGLIQGATAVVIDTHGQTLANTSSGAANGISSGGSLQIDSGDLLNTAGVISGLGTTRIDAATLSNAGQISSQGSLDIAGTGIDNRNGQIQALGDTIVNVGTGTVNNQAGLISTASSLTVNAAALLNQNTLGIDQGVAGANVTVNANEVNNASGSLLADRTLTLNGAGALNNTSGQISGQTVNIQDASYSRAIDNAGGQITAGEQLNLQVKGITGPGTLQSGLDVRIDLADSLANDGVILANRDLTLATQGDLSNAGEIKAGNQLEIQAGNIDNAVIGEISAGAAQLRAIDMITNRGLIDGGIARLDAAQIDNLGTGRIYGDHLSLNATVINNAEETVGAITQAGTIAARARLDIGVGTLNNNRRALIYSAGDAAIGGAVDADGFAIGTASTVNNTSAAIDVEGALEINATAINNVRENVTITAEGTQSIDETVNMQLPVWLQNGANSSSDIQSTSNYRAMEVYYLNPADILEQAPYITPDGYQVMRAVVRVSSATSAYLFENGSLDNATAEVSRFDPVDGTVTIYYSLRQDGQSNPDQVPGGDDPFAELEAQGRPTNYQSNTITYSDAYGTCTTDCVQLAALWRYSDPGHTIFNRYDIDSTNQLSHNEEQRNAHHTAFDDTVDPTIGAEAIIRSGGDMVLTTEALTNRFGQIAAGGDLTIDSVSGNGSVVNIGQTLYRTHYFNNTSIAYNGSSTAQWSNPSLSEVIGQVGGSITSNGTLTVNTGDLSNLNLGREAPNVTDASVLATINAGGARAAAEGLVPVLTTGGSATQVSTGPVSMLTPGQSSSVGGGTAPGGTASPQTTTVNGSGSVVSTASATGPGTIGTLALNTALPSNRLFQLNPNSSSYLIETDPRFADYRHWLSSDYLLNALGLDPTRMHKRLGDGFYEQRLVRDQIAQLTGLRFLEGYASDEEQYRALLEAGATFARAFGLRPGVALSAAQMAQLTSDIVWLVEQTVTLPDGTTATVLVPQVYVRLRPGDLRNDGTLIAANAMQMNLRGDLVNNGGTIAGRTVVSLTAENVQNLGGRIQGNDVALQARRDLINRGGVVQGANSVVASAGRDLVVQSITGNTDRVAGLYVTQPNGVLVASAGRDMTFTGAQVSSQGTMALSAGRDLAVTASMVTAGKNLVATAGRDLSVTSQAGAVTTTENGKYKGTTEVLDTAGLNAGGNVVLAAGNDVTLTAAKINAGQGIAVLADGDIVSNTVTTTDTEHSEYKEGKKKITTDTRDETLHGTELTAGGNIALQAGQDLTLTAASLTSEQGGIGLAAGRDVNLLAGEERHDFAQDTSKKKSGFLSSSKTTTHDEAHDTLAVGTTLSAETVQIAADRDVIAQGAQVVGTGDVTVVAGRDLTLEAAQSTRTEEHDVTKKKSGLMGTGGIGVMVGSRGQENTMESTSTYAVSTLVGSTDGNVVLRAGEQYTQIGSSVVAPQGDVAIIAKQVDIKAATENSVTTTGQTFKQSGIAVTLTNPVLDALQTAYQMSRASKQTSDGRVLALAAATTALSAKDAYGAVKANPAQAGGININISLLSDKSENSTTETVAKAVGSTVKAGGDISIIATGAGQDSDITVVGSTIKADGNAALLAEGDIALLAAQNTTEVDRKSTSNSASVGVGFALGSQNGFTISLAASQGKGTATGSETTQTNSQVEAGGQLLLSSGGDTTLKGAVARAEQVIAEVGGNLNIESLQDTSTYDSKSSTSGFSASLCIPPICYGASSASASQDKNKARSNYASVTEQSGIQAGDGGFQIAVKGNTDLVGGVVASTQAAIDANRNLLDTGTLTTSDLQNSSDAYAKSNGITLNTNMISGSKYEAAKGIASNALDSGSGSASSSGATYSAVSRGATIINDETGQLALTSTSVVETLASLNTDTANAHTSAELQDVNTLVAEAVVERQFKQAVYIEAVKFTDEAYRTMFLKSADMYEVTQDPATGKAVTRKLTEAEKSALEAGPDGKVNIATNGIFNGKYDDPAAAASYAMQHNAGSGPLYLVHFPQAENPLSELLVAGYQKYLENDVMGLTNSTQVVTNSMLQYGQSGLQLDGHSRGAMTIGNAMETLTGISGYQELLSGTTVRFFGPAYNAAAADTLLAGLQNRGAASNPDAMILTYQNHIADPVGRWIGGNPVTGGTIPEGSSWFGEVRRALGGTNTSHSCYGSGAVPCRELWRDQPDFIPVSKTPTSTQADGGP